jgi:hypothetical protein
MSCGKNFPSSLSLRPTFLFSFRSFHPSFLSFLLLYFFLLLIILSWSKPVYIRTPCLPLYSDYACSSLGVARTLMRSWYRSLEPPLVVHCRQAEETFRVQQSPLCLTDILRSLFLCIFMLYHWLPKYRAIHTKCVTHSPVPETRTGQWTLWVTLKRPSFTLRLSDMQVHKQVCSKSDRYKLHDRRLVNAFDGAHSISYVVIHIWVIFFK